MRIGMTLNQEGAVHEFAEVQIRCDELEVSCTLNLQFDKLRLCSGIPSNTALDLLLFASSVYAVDKLIPRVRFPDNWTRELELSVPVSDPILWSGVRDQLEICLSFLTGDRWQIGFEPLDIELYRPDRVRARQDLANQIAYEPKADAVSLFSGGLDSLIGAIDWLETHANRTLLLVGHHDGRVAGPLSDQQRLINVLQNHYPGRTQNLFVGIGQSRITRGETTFRSRSLLFMALGFYVSSGIGHDTPIYMPENGTISLNVPLSPSRRGSCSTRTTHPFFWNEIGTVLGLLGFANTIENPLALKSKGECVEQCANRDVLRDAALQSVSCAKRGHTYTWKNRHAYGCGRCMPCIYRRAALHKIGLDTEVYGRDICRGDIDVGSNQVQARDLTTCLSFLRQNPTHDEIANLLFTNGRLELSRLSQYTGLVERTMDEIRTLLSDKATDEIKALAGIVDDQEHA